jgi:hypothetical protein
MGDESTWEGELSINVAGLRSVGLGKIHLIKLEERDRFTVRVCPDCGNIPTKTPLPPQYHCEKCKKDYNTWHSLKQALPIDKEKGLPIPDRKTVKTLKAEVSCLDMTKARGLVSKNEYAIISLDEEAKKNMQMIGAMIKEFKKAVCFELTFAKSGERHLFYIAVEPDNTMRAREIIPINKVRNFPKEIQLFVEDAQVSGEQLKRLMESIPEKTIEDMKIESEADVLEKQISEMAKDSNATTLEKVLKGETTAKSSP